MNTGDLMKRYRCSRTTIFRWQKRDANPLPSPRFLAVGSPNLWAIDDIEKWEDDSANMAEQALCG